MHSAALESVIVETTSLRLRALPAGVVNLLCALDAPPRLAAHLRVVHDVAWQLVDRLERHLAVDRDEVLFGAASHDIGKVIHPAELSEPGHQHEPAGRDLLIQHGVDARLARFAGNHGDWSASERSTEDLLVTLADKVWKGKRVDDLELRIVDRLGDGHERAEPGEGERRERWERFMMLDDVLSQLAEGADARLAYQTRHPVKG